MRQEPLETFGPSDPPARVSSKEGRTRQPWVPSVYDIFRKVFNARAFTIQQERLFKDTFDRAHSEDVALEAIELMFHEGVVYPTGRDVKDAIERLTLKAAMQDWAEPPAGPYISFRDWYFLQDDAMKARIKRVFPSLTIYAEENDA